MLEKTVSDGESTGKGMISDEGDNVNKDELIKEQQRRIEQEIADRIPLIGELADISSLVGEYSEDPIYQSKAKVLQSEYSHIRRARPDGNCFYRAFGFAFLEKLLGDKTAFDKFHEIGANSKDILLSLGFPSFTVSDFHENFMSILDQVGNGMPLSDLLASFNDQSLSDYLIVYLRLLTSSQLQKEADFYVNFVDGYNTIKDFCQTEVEPMYKESDHVHAMALASAAGIGIRVKYLDRGTGNEVTSYDFPEGGSAPPLVHLLYRPGHYDILYA